MEKLNKRVILCSTSVILIIVFEISGAIILRSKDKPITNNKKQDSQITDNKIIQDVSPNEAEEMCGELTEKCTGVLI